MCRFVLYQGAPLTIASLVTEPANSIINQSFHSSETDEPLNGDGFGVAWYVPDLSLNPASFRSVSPAWSNQNLLELSRVTRSGCILAHVRAATPGLPVTELNCHPFTSGRYAFMHNGDVARFHAIRRRLLAEYSEYAFRAVRGSTDSEHFFGVFLDEVSRFPEDARSSERLPAALAATIARVMRMSDEVRAANPPVSMHDDGESDLNIAISDGVTSVACRYTSAPDRDPMSLYLHRGQQYICEEGVCRMIEPEKGTGAVIVSSEPLSKDPGWVKVPRNHMVVIHEDLQTETRPIGVQEH